MDKGLHTSRLHIRDGLGLKPTGDGSKNTLSPSFLMEIILAVHLLSLSGRTSYEMFQDPSHIPYLYSRDRQASESLLIKMVFTPPPPHTSHS